MLFLSCAVLALVPEYLIRSNLDIMYLFYNHFTTYFGDLWYCWNNYLTIGFPYPREYPSGIQLLFRGLFIIPGLKSNYNLYMMIISSILAVCAIVIAWIIYTIAAEDDVAKSRVYLVWLLSPAYLFYGLLNLDFLAILTMLLAYYYFRKNKYILSGVMLAIGMTIKVFPIFILPVLFFSCGWNKRLRLLASTVVTWLVFNIPLMIADFGAWSFPYMWQSHDNYAKSMSDGSWLWLVNTFLSNFNLGHLTGTLSFLLFIGLYIYLLKKNWHLALGNKLALVILVFLLTDRIYSPQYDLYLLPFLALSNIKISRKDFYTYFYLLEIPNFLLVFFCFYLKSTAPIALQVLLVCKYFALTMLLLGICVA